MDKRKTLEMFCFETLQKKTIFKRFLQHTLTVSRKIHFFAKDEQVFSEKSNMRENLKDMKVLGSEKSEPYGKRIDFLSFIGLEYIFSQQPGLRLFIIIANKNEFLFAVIHFFENFGF